MVNCPHCGVAVDERAAVCQNCGASLGGHGGEGTGDQQPQQSPGRQGQQGHGGQRGQRGPPGQQGRQGQPGQQGQPGRSQQGQSGQQGQAGRQSQQGQSGQQGQPNGRSNAQRGGQGRRTRQADVSGHSGGGRGQSGIGGYSRRDVLKYGGAGAAVLGGGVLAKGVFLGPDCSGPRGTVRCFFKALNDQNVEKAKSFAHSEKVDEFDSLVMGNFAWAQEYGEQFTGSSGADSSGSGPTLSTSIEKIEVRDESDGAATVVAFLSYDIPRTESGGSFKAVVDLRKVDSGWKIWAVEYDLGMFSGSGSTTDAP